jgi:hypothetical protein
MICSGYGDGGGPSEEERYLCWGFRERWSRENIGRNIRKVRLMTDGKLVEEFSGLDFQVLKGLYFALLCFASLSSDILCYAAGAICFCTCATFLSPRHEDPRQLKPRPFSRRRKSKYSRGRCPESPAEPNLEMTCLASPSPRFLNAGFV